MGTTISLVALLAYAARKVRHLEALRPHSRWLRKLGRPALGHHALNLALQAPALTLPIVVTAVLSAHMNAYFYVAWMIASFVFVISTSLATVLYALGAAEPAELPQKARLTLKLSLGFGALACLGLWIGADWVLSLFKADYVEQAGWCLRILGLGIFPLIVKNHYVAIRRVGGRVTSIAPWMAVGGLLELILAGIGASLGGLAGLSIGWLVAMCIEAVLMLPTVYRIATSHAISANQPVSEVVPSSPGAFVYPSD
jgi:O-antigen/teichoic acid export membrane protein